VSDNSDELATLGQQVLDALIATYNPHGDPSLALALHPGQALADGVVQDGTTNELRLSSWIADQYDYPLRLKLSDDSPISATFGVITAKDAYVAMIPYAEPLGAPDGAAFTRVSSLIAAARKDLGSTPDTLPFGVEPTDFAEPTSTAWQVFDTTISTTATTTTSEQPPSRIDPELWKLRPLSAQLVEALPARAGALAADRARVQQLSALTRVDAVQRMRALQAESFTVQEVPSEVVQPAAEASVASVLAEPVSRLALSPSVSNFARASVLTEGSVARAVLDNAQIGPVVADSEVLDVGVAARLTHIQIGDLQAQEPVTQTTTAGSELHVHFEHTLLTISRRVAGTRWWHPELVKDDGWFVPGMARGDMVASSTDPAYGYCLPQALLVVRNVSLTGTWTDEASSAMTSAISYLGPFLVAAPTSMQTQVAHGEQVTVLGLGVQVIGEMCTPLPPLPPSDDPAMPPSSPPPTVPADAPDPQVGLLQGAVHLPSSGVWDDATDSALELVRSAAHAAHVDPDPRALQTAVGTKVDGSWGPASAAALDGCVRAVQAALGVAADGSWGPVTDGAYVAVRTRAR